MITYFKKMIGELKIDQYKSISCKVDLEIDQFEHDEWADSNPDYNPDNYINDIRVIGEFNFDTSPIAWNDKHPVKINANGQLLVYHRSEDGLHTSKFNVLITEKINEVDVVPKKIRRYFWRFFIVGKPIWDHIHVFPDNYTGIKMNKVFSCTNFRGYWPTTVSSLVIAKDKQEARIILIKQLEILDIPIEDSNDFVLTEINLNERKAIILNDGSF